MKVNKKYTIEQNFKIDIKSLKIATNFPKMNDPTKTTLMEVFVFLQELNVEDQANKTWQYRHMFDYGEDEKKEEEEVKKATTA